MQKGGRRHESEIIRAFDAQLVSRLVMNSLRSEDVPYCGSWSALTTVPLPFEQAIFQGNQPACPARFFPTGMPPQNRVGPATPDLLGKPLSRLDDPKKICAWDDCWTSFSPMLHTERIAPPHFQPRSKISHRCCK